MNKVRIKEAAASIKNQIKNAAKRFSGNKTHSAGGHAKKPFGASGSAIGKGYDAAKDRSK
jgi:hypothetical protein